MILESIIKNRASAKRERTAKAKAGNLLNEMVLQNKLHLIGTKRIANLLKTDIRRLNKNIGFLTHEVDGRTKAIYINDDQRDIIKRIIESVREYKNLTKQNRKIVELCILGALKNDRIV